MSKQLYITFLAPLTSVNAYNLRNLLFRAVHELVEEVHLLLSVSNGDVHECVTLYHVLEALPTRLITHNIGKIHSTCNLIFLVGDERYANPGSVFTFHGIEFNQSHPSAGEKKLIEQIAGLRSGKKNISKIFAHHTQISNKRANELLSDEVCLDARSAKLEGFINEVIEARAPAHAQHVIIDEKT